MGESKTTHPVMTTCPIIGQAAGGAVVDQQRSQSPRLETCQAGPGSEDAPQLLGHPSLGWDPHRESSKSQNILLKWFLTSLLIKMFFSRHSTNDAVVRLLLCVSASLIANNRQKAKPFKHCRPYLTGRFQISKNFTKIFYDEIFIRKLFFSANNGPMQIYLSNCPMSNCTFSERPVN